MYTIVQLLFFYKLHLTNYIMKRVAKTSDATEVAKASETVNAVNPLAKKVIPQTSVQAKKLLADKAKKADDKKADVKKPADKKADKTPKAPKEKKVTLASKMDDIIHDGGKWDSILVKANAASKELGATTKFNIGTVKAHIAFRTKTQKKADYLGALKVTEAGIVA